MNKTKLVDDIVTKTVIQLMNSTNSELDMNQNMSMGSECNKDSKLRALLQEQHLAFCLKQARLNHDLGWGMRRIQDSETHCVNTADTCTFRKINESQMLVYSSSINQQASMKQAIKNGFKTKLDTNATADNTLQFGDKTTVDTTKMTKVFQDNDYNFVNSIMSKVSQTQNMDLKAGSYYMVDQTQTANIVSNKIQDLTGYVEARNEIADQVTATAKSDSLFSSLFGGIASLFDGNFKYVLLVVIGVVSLVMAFKYFQYLPKRKKP